MEKISFLILILMSALAGYIGSGKTRNMFNWIANTGFVFFAINVVCVYFGISDDFLIINNDFSIFMLQIIVIAVLAFLLRKGILNDFYITIRTKRITLSVIVMLLSITFMLLMIGYKYIQYGNYSAIFRALMPESVSLTLGLVFLIAMLIVVMSGFRSRNFSIINVRENCIPLTFCFTCSLYPFFETYCGNKKEFSLDISGALVYVILIFILEVIVVKLLTLFMGKKQQNLIYELLFSILVARYIQGMFLNGNLFVMDGNSMNWGTSLIVTNLLIWIAIIAILGVLYIRIKNFSTIIDYVALGILIIQFVGGISLIFGISDTKQNNQSFDGYFSTDGIYEAASDDNVYIFVLDTYDTDFLEEALSVEKEMLGELNGFTYYPDTVSQYSRTTPSMIYMLTNKEWYFDMPPSEYSERAYEECKFWDDAVEQNFSLYFYESDTWMVGSKTRENASNYVEKGNLTDKKYSLAGCLEAMRLVNGYRGLPYLYKSYFNYNSTVIEECVIDRMIWEREPYVLDDAYFYSNLNKHTIRINEDNKAIRIFHFNGAHAPFDLNAYGERVKKVNNSQMNQCIGSMRMVTDYIAKLKETGVYDQATIIITADHGENFVAEELPQPTNPILFIKPPFSGVDGCDTSKFEASQNDIMSTIAGIYRINSEGLTGVNILNTDARDRVRYHYYTVVRNSKQVQTRTYKVMGNSSDFSNWIPTEEYMDIYYINGDER